MKGIILIALLLGACSHAKKAYNPQDWIDCNDRLFAACDQTYPEPRHGWTEGAHGECILESFRYCTEKYNR